MSAIISIPKVNQFDSSQSPQKPAEIADQLIRNNGFFPDISLLDIRKAMRIDGTIPNERLKHSAINAMLTVNSDLAPLRLAHSLPALEEGDSDEIHGESVLVYRYKRAVYCLTVADLYERYRAFDSTKEGHQRADELAETAGELRREYHFAVRDLLNHNRMITELI